MNVFRYILLTLSAYRLTRLVTTDEWPPTDWLRNKVEYRMGPDSSWYKLVTCPWCAGVWIGGTVFLVDHYLWAPPLWLLGMVAAFAIIGLLGTYDER